MLFGDASKTGPERGKNLVPKQQRFIDEYLIDLNGTKAAIRAGYSEKTAGAQAARLLADARIAAEIQKQLESAKKELKITRTRVLSELATIAFANSTDFVTVEGGIAKAMDTTQIDPAKLPALAEVKETMYGVSVKMHDKVRALELLGKYLALFTGANDGSDVEDLAPLADMLAEKKQK